MDTTEPPRLTASLAELSRDPYPFTHELRRHGPVGWVDALGMWWVVGYKEVEAVLRDSTSFVAGTERSLLYDTFGEHMLTADGIEQTRQKSPFRSSFAPAAVRATMDVEIGLIVDGLIDSFYAAGSTDLRTAFASRLPVIAMLALFGLPRNEEARFRAMYDGFEAALSNFAWDQSVRDRAESDVAEFHRTLQEYIDGARIARSPGLLAQVVCDPGGSTLTDEEIRRNASIIFFGGISTVEALILNAVYVLATHAAVRERVQSDPELVPLLIEETMRWVSPVQSATRHVVRPVVLGGVALKPGDTVNCMLSAANRDPAVFADPDTFVLDRPNVKRHLGFAAGSHFCLGSHLAKLEARIAVTRLLERLPEFQMVEPDLVELTGFEFRQPRALDLRWPLREQC